MWDPMDRYNFDMAIGGGGDPGGITINGQPLVSYPQDRFGRYGTETRTSYVDYSTEKYNKETGGRLGTVVVVYTFTPFSKTFPNHSGRDAIKSTIGVGSVGIVGIIEVGIGAGTLRGVGQYSVSAIKSGLRAAKNLGGAAAVLTAMSVGYDVITTGKLTGSNISSLFLTAGAVTLGVVLAPVAAPFVAAGAVVLGLASLAAEDWLNEKIGTVTIFEPEAR